MKKALYLTLSIKFALATSFAADKYEGENIKYQPTKTPNVQVKIEKEVDKGHWLEKADTTAPREIASEDDATMRGPSSSDNFEKGKSEKGLRYWQHKKKTELWPETKYWQFKQKPL